MKLRALLLFSILCSGLSMLAQSANFNGFTYQAVVRDAVGDPVANQAVGLQAVIQVGPSDTYVETHAPTTDAYGLVSVVIGQGTPTGGSAIATFGDIDWAGGLPITYTVNVDVSGGTAYTFLSGGPFKAVPFAYHALSSDSSGTSTPQTLTLSNDTLYLSGGGSVYLGGLANDNDWVVSGDTLHNGGKRVGIGTTAPENTLHVVGGFKYQDGGQADGHVLMSNAEGHASWRKLGAEALFATVPGTDDISCSNLSIVGDVNFEANSGTRGVAVLGSYCYVTDREKNKLRVVDVSNPASPSEVNTIAMMEPLAIHIDGSTAYVLDRIADQLYIYDLSAPATPVQIGSFPTGAEPRNVFASGGLAYVMDEGSDDLKLIDVSNPASPTLVGSISLGSLDWPKVVAQGGYAYVIDQNSDALRVIDVNTPSSPTVVATLGIGAEPNSIEVNGHYAYTVGFGSDLLNIIDISDPTDPLIVGSLPLGNAPRRLQVRGNLVLVIDNVARDIKAIDVSDPTGPVVVSTLSSGTYPWDIDIQGDYAYIVDLEDDDLKILHFDCASDTTYSQVVYNQTTQAFESQAAAWDLSGEDLHNTNSGNVGIGTTAPEHKLDVNGIVRVKDHLTFNSANGVVNWGPSGTLHFRSLNEVGNNTGFSDRMAITASGNVGIGVVTPDEKLVVEGGRIKTSVGYTCKAGINGGYGNAFNFFWTGASLQAWIDNVNVGTVQFTSDRRLKEHISPITTSAIDRVKLLRPVTYNYRKIEGSIFTGDSVQHEGFIADELQAVIPSAVNGEKDARTADGGIQPQTVNSMPVISVLTKAIQEQQALIEEQRARIAALEAGNTAKDAALDAIRAQLDANTALIQQLQQMLDARIGK